MRGIGLTPTGVSRATETARRVLGQGPNSAGSRRRGSQGEGVLYQGFLTEDLESGTMVVPTTAEMTIWLPDPESDAEVPPFVESDLDPITVVNRDESLELDAGTHLVVMFINGEWKPIWASC